MLLADLLNYHRREAKPEWWAYFERQKKSLDDLVDDTEAIARLSAAADERPALDKRSTIVPLDFPDQEYKLGPPAKVEDPFRAAAAGEMVCLDGQRRRLHLRRGPSLKDTPLPAAIVKGKPLDDRTQRDALGRLADEIIAGGSGYRAVRDLLSRTYPRIRGRQSGDTIQTIHLDEQKALVAGLDESYLFFQGPPGSGKTWTGARLIVSLIAAGSRIGVAALSHKAINNLLEEVERVAGDQRVNFAGLKKNSDEDDEFDGEFIENTTENADCETSDAQLVAGTSWLFAREGMQGRIDFLFIDEAGQLSLADTVGHEHRCDEHRAAGRSAAASTDSTRHPSRRRRALGARAPSARLLDRGCRSRHLPGTHLPDASRRVPVHLAAGLRWTSSQRRGVPTTSHNVHRAVARGVAVCRR